MKEFGDPSKGPRGFTPPGDATPFGESQTEVALNDTACQGDFHDHGDREHGDWHGHAHPSVSSRDPPVGDRCAARQPLRGLAGARAVYERAARGVPVTALMHRFTSAALHFPIEGALPSLDGATDWLNTPPLTAEALRGKVVLVDIWTYTCINWLRTLPYVRAWDQKYRDQGLVVLGVSDPEFMFEHDVDNVRRAVQAMHITYPIAIDNRFAIWRGLNNHYWPALYFVDVEGRIRQHHFGEGAYERSERIIQQLLSDAGVSDTGRELVAVQGRGLEAAADWDDLKSPETYLGYERTERFASPSGLAEGLRRVYAAP